MSKWMLFARLGKIVNSPRVDVPRTQRALVLARHMSANPCTSNNIRLPKIFRKASWALF